jgi:hypothetical protein
MSAACAYRFLGDVARRREPLDIEQAALSTAIALYCDMDMPFWLPQAETALAQVDGSC